MNYELVLVLKPLLPEDLKTKVLKKVEEYIAQEGGKLGKKDIWGKKHLAFPIKKHEEGYYVLYNFSISTDKLKEFEKELTLMGDVLRHMVVKLD